MHHTRLSIRLSLLACIALLLSGCATIQEASNSLSCMLAHVTSASDCGGATQAGGSQAERFARLQAALNQETQQARQSQGRAVQAMRGLPAGQRALAGPVRTAQVRITDGQSGGARSMTVFSSLSVEMPLAAKGRAEYTQAMDALKGLANNLADNRGSSSIVVEQSDADVRAERVNTSTGTTYSQGGKPVTVIKKVDPALPAGQERYTIEAGEIRGKL